MKISNYKSIDRGSLLAAFDLELSTGIVFYGMLLFTGTNGPWCKFPEVPQYKDNAPLLKDGKQVYKRIIAIPDRDRSDKFSAQVLEALREGGHYNG